MIKVVNGEGHVVALFPRGKRTAIEQARDVRMMMFAGKLHWENGNLTGSIASAVQDLRYLTTADIPMERMKELLSKIADQLHRDRAAQHKAYEGALLLGEDAAAFDATWNQDGIPDPQRILDGGDIKRYASIFEMPAEDVVALVEAQGGAKTHTEKLRIAAAARAESRKAAVAHDGEANRLFEDRFGGALERKASHSENKQKQLHIARAQRSRELVSPERDVPASDIG